MDAVCGDAINNPEVVFNVTLKFLKWLFDNQFSAGLDGVDLSTVLPPLKNKKWILIFQNLEKELKQFKINPIYHMDNFEYSNNFYSHKNIFRLFYSVESAIQESRDIIVPNAEKLVNSIQLLSEYQQNGKYPVIFHHLIIEGLNDSDQEIDSLISFINDNFENNELRILRYNFCAKSSYKESDKFISQIKKISNYVKFLKVQVSPRNRSIRSLWSIYC